MDPILFLNTPVGDDGFIHLVRLYHLPPVLHVQRHDGLFGSRGSLLLTQQLHCRAVLTDCKLHMALFDQKGCMKQVLDRLCKGLGVHQERYHVHFTQSLALGFLFFLFQLGNLLQVAFLLPLGCLPQNNGELFVVPFDGRQLVVVLFLLLDFFRTVVFLLALLVFLVLVSGLSAPRPLTLDRLKVGLEWARQKLYTARHGVVTSTGLLSKRSPIKRTIR